MASLLLAPYNDSMRLGQGYNSFLQTPCLSNAVSISGQVYKNGGGDGASSTSQSVTYSSSFVDKISEVVRSMNISAGASIRTGSIAAGSGGSSIDELKFSESDMNMVVSVKVVNQTRQLIDNMKFNEHDLKDLDTVSFHELYGDCFISGFMEGGDLHGIISVRSIETANKNEVKDALKSAFNSSSKGWSMSESSPFGEVTQQCEITVNVNWSGGGLIKDSTEEWTIDSLLKAASAFPENVSKCPQYTYAILTRYDTIPSFATYIRDNGSKIQLRRYDAAQMYASELLDMFVEYKANLLILNDAIRHPGKYVTNSSEEAVTVEIKELINERKRTRLEMAKISEHVDALNRDPKAFFGQKNPTDQIVDPELWRSRLPVRKIMDQAAAQRQQLEELLAGLPISNTQQALPGLPRDKPTPEPNNDIKTALPPIIESWREWYTERLNYPRFGEWLSKSVPDGGKWSTFVQNSQKREDRIEKIEVSVDDERMITKLLVKATSVDTTQTATSIPPVGTIRTFVWNARDHDDRIKVVTWGFADSAKATSAGRLSYLQIESSKQEPFAVGDRESSVKMTSRAAKDEGLAAAWIYTVEGTIQLFGPIWGQVTH